MLEPKFIKSMSLLFTAMSSVPGTEPGMWQMLSKYSLNKYCFCERINSCTFVYGGQILISGNKHWLVLKIPWFHLFLFNLNREGVFQDINAQYAFYCGRKKREGKADSLFPLDFRVKYVKFT